MLDSVDGSQRQLCKISTGGSVGGHQPGLLERYYIGEINILMSEHRPSVEAPSLTTRGSSVLFWWQSVTQSTGWGHHLQAQDTACFVIDFRGHNCLRCTDFWHSRARWVMEKAFCILAARWRILGWTRDCYTCTAEDITKACVILHNFLCVADRGLPEQNRYIPPSMWDTDGVPG